MQQLLAFLLAIDRWFCVADDDGFFETQSVVVTVAGEDLVIEISCTFLEVFADG